MGSVTPFTSFFSFLSSPPVSVCTSLQKVQICKVMAFSTGEGGEVVQIPIWEQKDQCPQEGLGPGLLRPLMPALQGQWRGFCGWLKNIAGAVCAATGVCLPLNTEMEIFSPYPQPPPPCGVLSYSGLASQLLLGWESGMT